MHFKIQVVIEEESGQSTLEDVVELSKGLDHKNTVGLSLLESKQLLQSLQRTIVLHQAASYSEAHQDCPCCQNVLPEKTQNQRAPHYSVSKPVRYCCYPKFAPLSLFMCQRVDKIIQSAKRMVTRTYQP